MAKDNQFISELAAYITGANPGHHLSAALRSLRGKEIPPKSAILYHYKHGYVPVPYADIGKPFYNDWNTVCSGADLMNYRDFDYFSKLAAEALKACEKKGIKLKQITVDWNFLAEIGLQEFINRAILHPMGLAVARDPHKGASPFALVAPDLAWQYENGSTMRPEHSLLKAKAAVAKRLYEILTERLTANDWKPEGNK